MGWCSIVKVKCYLSGNPSHDLVIESFAKGCNGELVRDWKYEPSDIAVIFGVFKSKVKISWPRGEIFRQQRDNNLDVLVLETGYINRGDGNTHHYAAGFNGLNGRADFKNKGMRSDRWEKLGVKLKPYSGGEKVILCGQVPWDASVDMHDHVKWLKSTASNLQKITDRPVVFRPHPLAKLPPLQGCEYSTRPLAEDLPNANCVVTWNSNSAVEAAILGKAVVAMDAGSMAYEIANKSILYVDEPACLPRMQWAYDLAYCQWTIEEMKSGEAWAHLQRS